MIEKNSIHCIDCLEGLKQLEDSSVSFIFTDPPYNMKKDYEVYKDDLSEDEYEDWMKEIVSEMKRVSNNNLSIFMSDKRLKFFWDMLPDAKLIIVHKRAIGSFEKGYFSQHFGLLTTKEPVKRTHNVWNDVRLPGEGYFFKEERFSNPGLTSELLVKKIIKTFTEVGDLVLDPFVGSGTTSVVSKGLERDYIGFDINPEYLKIAEERLKKVALVDEWL